MTRGTQEEGGTPPPASTCSGGSGQGLASLPNRPDGRPDRGPDIRRHRRTPGQGVGRSARPHCRSSAAGRGDHRRQAMATAGRATAHRGCAPVTEHGDQKPCGLCVSWCRGARVNSLRDRPVRRRNLARGASPSGIPGGHGNIPMTCRHAGRDAVGGVDTSGAPKQKSRGRRRGPCVAASRCRHGRAQADRRNGTVDGRADRSLRRASDGAAEAERVRGAAGSVNRGRRS